MWNLYSSRSRGTSPEDVAARSKERVALRSFGDSAVGPEPERGLCAPAVSAETGNAPLPWFDPVSLALLGADALAPPSVAEMGGGGGEGMMLPLGVDGAESAAARRSGLRRTFMFGAGWSVLLTLALAAFFKLGDDVDDALVSSAPRLLRCFRASQRMCHIPHAEARNINTNNQHVREMGAREEELNRWFT